MPEIDLTKGENSILFVKWRSEKIDSGECETQGEGKLNSGEYIVADLINNEPVNSFSISKSPTRPGFYKRAEVSDKHKEELEPMGVIFEPEKYSEKFIRRVVAGHIERNGGW